MTARKKSVELQSEIKDRVLRRVITETLPVLDVAIKELTGMYHTRKAERNLRAIKQAIARIAYRKRGGFADRQTDRRYSNGKPKLNETSVKAIREQLRDYVPRKTPRAGRRIGAGMYMALAEQYGVSKTLIARIHKGTAWRHVQ